MYMLKYNIRYLKKLFTNNFENKLNLPKKNALRSLQGQMILSAKVFFQSYQQAFVCKHNTTIYTYLTTLLHYSLCQRLCDFIHQRPLFFQTNKSTCNILIYISYQNLICFCFTYAFYHQQTLFRCICNSFHCKISCFFHFLNICSTDTIRLQICNIITSTK